jgi:membrane associated rhomboid family serine protease
MLLYWILFQFIAGLGSLGFSGAGGIAYFAHIGGFLAGVIITTISWPLINKSNR